MISKLQILNFQSHRDSALEFHPGVNVIVGTTDSGKSAIKRALYWLFKNRPNGDGFRSNWGGPTAVTVLTGDGHTITRGKTDSDNVYKHNSGTFEGFGTNVPESVQSALNIDETNLQSQFDAPFLISQSPGEVAAYFNRIAHLDQIDSGLKNIAASIRKLSSQADVYKDQLAEAEAAEKRYDYIEKFEIQLESLEALAGTVSGKRQHRTDLMILTNRIVEVEGFIEGHGKILAHEEATDKILHLYSQKEGVWQELVQLQELSAEISVLDSDIDYIKEEAKALPKVESLIGLWQSRHQLVKKKEDLNQLMERIVDITSDIADAEQDLGENESTFHQAMPDTCPLCNQQVKK